MRNQRGIHDRFLSAAFGFFVACALVYFGIQLLRSVLTWLMVGAAVGVVVTLATMAMRWRRERW